MSDTQRERLIEILNQDNCPSPYICDENCKYSDLERCYEARIADLLLSNGVIVPPCKVGDTVYFHHIIGINKDSSPIKKVRAGIIHKIQVEMDNQIWIGVSFGIWYCCRPYTDFYFNREAAEQALKGSVKNETEKIHLQKRPMCLDAADRNRHCALSVHRLHLRDGQADVHGHE